MPECYIRGNTIKYLRVPDEVFMQAVSLLECLLVTFDTSVDLIYMLA